MKGKIIKALTALMLIVTLTMANFILLCVNAISYASEVVNMQTETNNKNVEFMAYFKNEQGDKITDLEVFSDTANLKAHFQISIKQEGYFNGKIVLNNSNFKFKSENTNSLINKIEDNVIYLNQINAGETPEIEVGIDLILDENFKLENLNKETDISIEGIYRDSSEKDIEIKANRNVKLILAVPESNENIDLTQRIITNKVLNYNGEDKRIIQVEIMTNLVNNIYPISNTNIKIQTPKITDKYPENVLVNSNNVLATNGKMLSNDNWEYNKDAGLIEIQIENEVIDGNISWIKNQKDNFIITYIFDKDVKIQNQEINTNVSYKLFDENNTLLEKTNKIIIDNSEVNNIVTNSIIHSESSIYKGKLEAGISRDIKYTNVINVNLDNVAQSIDITELTNKINGQDINSTYRMTKINKEQLKNILGDKGKLEILNAQTNEVIASFDKSNIESQEDIIINYDNNIQTIKIILSNIEQIGKLELENIKTLNLIDKTLMQNAKSLDFIIKKSYLSNNSVSELENTTSSLELKDTITSVDLQMNRTELSTMKKNEDVEFRVLLNSKTENNKLFKNPKIRLQLPEKIENIEINSVNLIYEDELKISSVNLLPGNILEIQLSGEQTKYKEEAIDGAILIINTNLSTNNKLTSSVEQINLVYENNGIQGQLSKEINLVSYAGVVTINKIEDYGVELINNEGNKTATLGVSEQSKNIKIENEIINNEENEISNVKILGTFPTKGVLENNIPMSLASNINVTGIDVSKAKVYYSENAEANANLDDKNNNWTETISDNQNVKKYLVVTDKLDVTEGIGISYDVNIPENLDYNASSKEGYSVYYTSSSVDKSVNLDNVELNTPKGATLNTTLKTTVAGKETSEVRENEIIRYEMIVSNTGSEDISNAKIVATIPEGTTFVNSETIRQENDLEELQFYDENKKDLEVIIDNLKQGETVTKYYEVKVNEGMANKEIKNKITTQYGEVSKESNEVITKVDEGRMELKLISIDSIEGIVTSGYPYRFVLEVTNHSDKNMKNIDVKINESDLFNVSKIYYMNSSEETMINENNNQITIDNLQAGETLQIGITVTINIFKELQDNDMNISVTNVYDDEEYNSNEITLDLKSNLNLQMTVMSKNANKYVKANDIITYNIAVTNMGEDAVDNVILDNWISNNVTLKTVTRNGKELTNSEYSLNIDEDKNQKLLEIKEQQLQKGETIQYKVEVIANLIFGNEEAEEIINTNMLKVDSMEVQTIETKHILQPENMSPDSGDNDNSDNENNSGSNEEQDNKLEYHIISGTAWLDENENGSKDNNEKSFEGLTVKILDAEKNEYVKDENGNDLMTKTSSTGFYSFSKVPKGQYIVIFEYDTVQYGLTAYRSEGVSDELNSKVIAKNIKISGQEQKVAATEIIKMDSENIANINIGLITAKKYDLQLDKFISKVTIQNKTTTTKTYENATLAKEEIHAKQVNGSTVIVEYIIRVTNNGDVPAYVRKIVDYLSSDYKFSSELNKDWYQSGNDVYCTSLANAKLEPGESKDVKLTVIKEMTESNTGLVNNTAEIAESYNEYGLKDINSTEGNKVNGENDMGSADLIISIKTGEVVMTITLVITSIVILGVAVYLLRKIFINGKIL